jgi:hypothetical protein
MTRRRSVAAIAGIGVLAVLLAPDTVSAQCAMCRRALDSPEGQQLIGALRRGIVVLLAAPFMLFGVVALLAVRMQRRRHAPSLKPQAVASAMQPPADRPRFRR